MPRTPQNRVKVNVYLQVKILSGLKKLAQIKGTSYSELIRVACHEYILREGPKVIAEHKEMEHITGR